MTTNEGLHTNFEIAASFVGDLVVLTLRGEVDNLTAPEFLRRLSLENSRPLLERANDLVTSTQRYDLDCGDASYG
jgi:hypothetical protein